MNWVPEIMYEDAEEGGNSHIPFIMVPEDQTMPNILFIFESKDTGEFEPGLEGNAVPVYEWDLHQYADMVILKNNLDTETYDKVRTALGLESLEIATAKGLEIGEKVRNNLS